MPMMHRRGHTPTAPFRRVLTAAAVALVSGVGSALPALSTPAAAGIPTTWSVTPSPNDSASGFSSQLNAVSCVGPSFCLAVGQVTNGGLIQTLAEEWNGTTWSIVTTPNPPDNTDSPLESVSCVSATLCTAVGYTGGNEPTSSPLIDQWNGTTWTTSYPTAVPLPPSGLRGQLYGVDCLSSTFCMASGSWESTALIPTALALTWNGSTWATSPVQYVGTAEVLSAVSCATTTTCTAVGNWTGVPGGPLAEQFNGSTWTITLNGFGGTLSASDGVFSSVSCPTASGCMAVGHSLNGSTTVADGLWWNGAQWTPVTVSGLPTNESSQFSGVSCAPAVGCSATGQVDNGAALLTVVANWTGQSLVRASTPNPDVTSLNVATGISCLSNVACVVVGSSGTPTAQTMVLTGPVLPLGYWLSGSDGGIFSFGNAIFYGSTGGIALNKPIVDLVATPDGDGYWLVGSDGGIFSFGDAAFYGSTGSLTLNKPIVGMAATPDGKGYWLVGSDGGIFSFGDAAFYGSTGGVPLNKPIVAMTATPDGKGYWLVGSDGGIFSFGDAAFYGSTGSLTLNKPIVGMAATPDGKGYWLVGSDGGIFSFGDAAFYGSTGSLTLNKPIIGMASSLDGHGYWLVASDGGIFTFGDATFDGSTGALTLAKPIVAMMVTKDGAGYWLVAADGGIFAFGDAVFLGSLGGQTLNKPIVAAAAA